jgi:hypothetical protein
MFRTVFPSINRSSRMYIQQQVYVKQIPLPACQRERDGTQLHFVLASNSICLTYTCCCMYILELLVMGEKTVRNMKCYSKINLRNWCI